MTEQRRPKIYVASSWSNSALLDEVHAALQKRGFDTLDFRAQGRWWSKDEGDSGDPIYGRIYTHAGVGAFEYDMELMRQADGAFIVHPCGIATALEAGWFAGAGLPMVVWGREVRSPLDITWMLCTDLGELELGRTLTEAVDSLAGVFLFTAIEAAPLVIGGSNE